METIAITSTTPFDDEVRRLYENSFPSDELITWDVLLQLIDKLKLDFTAYYEDAVFVGFTIVYPMPKYTWFWYFAVREDLRGQGVGQRILSVLIEKYQSHTCLLDVESPLQTGCNNLDIRERRHDFYLRNGFRDTCVYRYYGDVLMTIMIKGSGTFTLEDWDALIAQFRSRRR